MKVFLPSLVALFFSTVLQAQQTVLYTLTFDNAADSSAVVFDSSFVGSNTGHNDWIVNNIYTGSPNTPNEDSVVAGTITNAPFSNYLHVHNINDLAANSDADWDTSAVSDRFCYLNTPFCTLGQTNVIFSFFWIGEGDSGAYAELYYRSNNSPWTQTGQTKYYGQSKWLYETVQDSGFNNVQNLQFGFRWVNQVDNHSPDVSLGLDDILIVGTYDSLNPPKISISLYDTTTICQGNPQIFQMQFSEPLCEGDYQIQMSNATGNFSNPVNLGVYSLGVDTGALFLSTLNTPTNVTGNCFQLRVVRTNPAPVIISDTTACFSIIQCPALIYDLISVVTNDPDTACVLSELDVQFNSTGAFNNNNTYTAEISDTNGSFQNYAVLGTFQSSYPYSGFPQGSIACLIPSNIPAGCGYFIRIVSSSPATTSSLLGPFCLKHCDILTNNHTDRNLCIQSGPYGHCDTINIEPHYWNSNISYDTCNKWNVQLRRMMDFSFMANLTAFHDGIGGNFTLCVPDSADSLAAMGIAPGAYYLRIVSTCSSDTSNQNGTIVRISIGAPNPTPPLLAFNDSGVYCNNGEIDVTVTPFNSPPSTYYWTSNLLNNGITFSWPYDPLRVTLNANVALGTYEFFVQEDNFGCIGPFSQVGYATIIGNPIDTVTGPTIVCPFDTAVFQCYFQPGTYYSWNVGSGTVIADTGNNQIKVVFADTGNYNISVNSLNMCGTNSGSYNVSVQGGFTLSSFPNDTPCVGASDTLTVNSLAGDTASYLWSNGDTTSSISFTAAQTQSYSVFVSDHAGCNVTEQISINARNCTAGTDIVLNNNQDFNIIPNPTSGKLWVEGIDNAKSIIIYNLDGEKLKEASKFENTIDISDLAEGVYLVAVTTEQNSYIRKVILIK